MKSKFIKTFAPYNKDCSMILQPEYLSKIYDISPFISSESSVFPGDKPFYEKVTLDYKKGDKIKLSSFEMSPHIGAHADAPLHYSEGGKAIDQQSLEIYMGPCTVIDVSKTKNIRLLPQDIKLVQKLNPRVLFKTNSIKSFNHWQDDFIALSPELVFELSKREVILVGIDTPSVDPSKDSELLSHTACFNYDVSILENLDLKNVQEGNYNLIALPLKLKGLEASPTRAILIG